MSKTQLPVYSNQSSLNSHANLGHIFLAAMIMTAAMPVTIAALKLKSSFCQADLHTARGCLQPPGLIEDYASITKTHDAMYLDEGGDMNDHMIAAPRVMNGSDALVIPSATSPSSFKAGGRPTAAPAGYLIKEGY